MGSVLTPAREDAAHAYTACIERLAAVRWDDIPPPVRARAVAVLADDLAAAFSACGEPEVMRLRERRLREEGGGGPCSLLAPGRPRAGLRTAAALNGLAMGWNELDEGYRKAVCHAGLYVLPALLASAEAAGASARDLLRALVLGYETVARVARAWKYARMRIHPHAMLAPVGAAAGVAMLRGLAPDRIVSAVGGACALGMAGPFNQAVIGALVRNAWASQGAVAGIDAADMAEVGIGGFAGTPYDVYVGALGDGMDLAAFAEDGDWAIASGYQKINACCQYTHSTIEAVQALIAENAAIRGGAAVTAVRVQAHPLALGLENRDPPTTLGAKFSLPHAVAAAIVHGDGGVQSFNAASLDDARVARLRASVVIEPFPENRPFPHDRPATVHITTAAGTATATVWSARGGPDRPIAAEDIAAKIETLCAPVAPRAPGVLRELAEAALGSSSLEGKWSGWLDAMFEQ
jgi:2-methylcitrate dehydratase PrpD